MLSDYYCSSVCGQQQLSGIWNLICSTFRLDLQKVGPAETSPWRWEGRSAENPDRHIKGVRRVYFCRGVATQSLWTCSTCICSPSSLKWRTVQGDFLQRRRYLGEEQVVFKWLCGIIDQFDQFWHNFITGELINIMYLVSELLIVQFYCMGITIFTFYHCFYVNQLVMLCKALYSTFGG